MLDPEHVSVSKLVIVPDATSAREFLTEIFPYYANVLVYSCDDEYPKNAALRAHVKHAIETDPSISVAVVNYDCFNRISIATPRVFVLDEILVNDLRVHNAYEPMVLQVTPKTVAVLLEGWFKQQAQIERVNNMTTYYRTHVEMPKDDLDWKMRLLVGRS